jgi:hypothetical protein
MASLTSLIALVVTALYGGWEWALLSFVVLVTLWPAQFSVVPMLATMGVSFFWLALFHSTGDRRLFFPYAMQFAVQMPYLLQGRVPKPAIAGGGGVIAVFMLIRIAQSATVGVLIVELFVATAILALVLKLCGPKCREARTRVIAGILGSALAFAGLAI